jgi:pimeloyl-ACP methyl ester carboxylesterase
MLVLLHGVPETSAIWRKLRARVARESIALSLPGFGSPVPEGFTGTKDEYVAWVVAELEQIDDPIDLVGHDWGALLTYRVATARGDRVRSWVADIGNVAHPDYVWHDVAQLWQTPEAGESFVEVQLATPLADRAKLMEAAGLSPEDALEMMASFDAAMGASILALYRSSTPNVHAAWGPWSPTQAPGLVIHPVDDPFSDARLASETATALGARFVSVDGAGHFWPYQSPAALAAVLESFWAEVAT